MKRWKPTATVLLSMAALLLAPATALAQDGDDLPPVLASITVKIAVFIDGLLGYAVSGNTLTEGWASMLDTLTHVVVRVVHYLAVLLPLP